MILQAKNSTYLVGSLVIQKLHVKVNAIMMAAP
jgi:hypothetical protein